jgi:O-antigen/teichoic acid export membrane protein
LLASFLWKLLSAPFERACRLLVILVAAPALGATAFGTYQYASTVTAMLAAASELGLGTWATRSIAREPEHAGESMATGLWLRVATVAPYVVVVSLLAVLHSSVERWALLAFGAFAIASSLVDFFGAILRGHEEFREEALLNAFRAVLTTTGALAALAVAGSLLGLAAGMTAGAVASALGGALFLRRRYRQARKPRFPTRDVSRSVFHEAIPLWVSGMLAMLYFRSDVVIVRYFSGDAEVGAYAAAYRIFEATLLVPSAVMAVAFPRLARALDPGPRVTSLELGLVAGLLALGLGVASIIVLAEGRIVLGLLGKTFDRSAPSLHVLSWTIPVMFVSYALSFFVIARGRERPFAKILAALLVVNVALNVALVPRLGGVGAAWSTLATEVLLIVGCVAILLRGARVTPPSGRGAAATASR